MQRLLEGVEFRDPSRARDVVIRLGSGLPERIAERIQLLLAAIPDPDTSLRCLERLREHAPAAFERLRDASTMKILVAPNGP